MQGRTITFSRNVFLPLTTACRNRCSYCCFRTPVQEGCILPPEAVERALRLGGGTGCTEALFTFGERPEQEPGFADLLSASGYASILDYCYAMSERALQYGLLPHTNAGILAPGEMERLREVNASLGLMLETTARIPAHRNSPGKIPEVRIQMIEDAGRLRIPFTTGILVGIGESENDREESLAVIRNLHRRYGHIQEVIIQNFCAKKNTPMAAAAPPTTEQMCRTIALAREILPGDVAVQIAPNLIDASRLLRCGADDLGGISPCTIDYVNPEHPWPQIQDLKILAGDAELRERLCIYPQYIEKGWFHPRIEALIRALAQQVQERRW